MLQYNDLSGAIQNNGWVSESFTLSIGVSQGCLMSPYLFDDDDDDTFIKVSRL